LNLNAVGFVRFLLDVAGAKVKVAVVVVAIMVVVTAAAAVLAEELNGFFSRSAFS